MKQEIQYNLLNLPSSINYQSGNMASYVYSASGAKLSVTYTNGATTTTNQYCGNMLYENGTLKQILIDGGYITFSGTTPQYHFYLKDHLGNNRVVVSAGGTVEQVNHYYPYGGLMGESTNGDLQRFKYNGKELDRMNGLDWLDYGARHFDAARVSWPAMDPMCEKYYDVSPYVYCKDNPVIYVDKDGMKFDLSNLTDEQLEQYKSVMDELCINSPLFSNIVKSLAESDNIYTISLGNPISDSNNCPIDGQFVVDDAGGKILLSESKFMGNCINATAYAEEYFHAYQHDNSVFYDSGSFNREFEAKVFATAVGLETSGYGDYNGMSDFQVAISSGVYGNSIQPISPQVANSLSFQKEYITRANSYAKYNIINNIGNSNYRISTTISPYSLIKVINSAYTK